MSKQQHPPPPHGNGPNAKNQGEGDPESARRYNKSQQDFVKSARGRAAIEDAGDVDPDELEDLEGAEQARLARQGGRSRSPASHHRYQGRQAMS